MPTRANQPPGQPPRQPPANQPPAGGVAVNVAPANPPTHRKKRTKEDVEEEAKELAAHAKRFKKTMLDERGEALERQKIRNVQRYKDAREKWKRMLTDSNANHRDMDTYRESLALLVEMAEDAALFAEVLATMAAAAFPGLYPQTAGEMSAALTSGLKSLGRALIKKIADNPLTSNLQFTVTRDEHGVLQSDVVIRGQSIKGVSGDSEMQQAILATYDHLVQDYVMSEGYDVEVGPQGEATIVYGANHPDAGDVISAEDFNELFKDNCKALREEFIERAIEKSPQLRI
jgi:hypothetical protein